MATPRYAHCLIHDIRCAVERRLNLPAPKGRRESAAEFWARAEQAGRLAEALALYDRIAADWAVWARIPRETTVQFLQRVEREGRRAEAERALAELLASGLSRREAQEELVGRFQPLDGTRVRAWPTPDPWEAGRLFHRKADQDELLAAVSDEDEGDAEQTEAQNRVAWARFRQRERLALAAARWRARELKESASAAEAAAPATPG
jgi:hypothetical protein